MITKVIKHTVPKCLTKRLQEVKAGLLKMDQPQ